MADGAWGEGARLRLGDELVSVVGCTVVLSGEGGVVFALRGRGAYMLPVLRVVGRELESQVEDRSYAVH